MNFVEDEISGVPSLNAASVEPETQSQSAVTALAGVSAALLTACGGGGEEDGAAAAAEAPQSQQPKAQGVYQAQAPTTMTRVAAARFLQQAGFGGNQDDVNEVTSLGLHGWIEKQIKKPIGKTTRFELLNPVTVTPRSNGTKSPFHWNGVDNVLWRKLITSDDVLRQRVTLALSEIFVVSMDQTEYSWCGASLVNYMDRLEACALGNPDREVVENGRGTYRYLLEKVTLSHAMGRYLSMFGSEKADGKGRLPDENFAREVLQLFSIGLYQLRQNGDPKRNSAGERIPAYTSADVTALARAFTGWNWNGFTDDSADFIQRDMHAGSYSAAHDTGKKDIPALRLEIPSGQTAHQEMKMVLDSIASHPNVGPFFCRQLIQRLVTSNPSAEYVEAVANVFNNNGNGVRGDLRAVVTAILTNERAQTVITSTRGGRLIPPMNRFLQWARTFRATSTSGNWLIAPLPYPKKPVKPDGNLSDPVYGLGQSPLRSPSVFNFYRPGYVHPGTPGDTTAMGAEGRTAPEFQITNEATVVGYSNFMQAAILGARRWINGNGLERYTPLDVVGDYAVKDSSSPLLDLAKNPAALFDELNLLLAAGRLDATTRTEMVNAVAAMPNENVDIKLDNHPRQWEVRRVGAMIWLIMCSPQYLVQK